jgi:hypothetical protein
MIIAHSPYKPLSSSTLQACDDFTIFLVSGRKTEQTSALTSYWSISIIFVWNLWAVAGIIVHTCNLNISITSTMSFGMALFIINLWWCTDYSCGLLLIKLVFEQFAWLNLRLNPLLILTAHSFRSWWQDRLHKATTYYFQRLTLRALLHTIHATSNHCIENVPQT